MNTNNNTQGGTMKQKSLSFLFFTIAVLSANAAFSDAAQAGRYELAKYIPTGVHVDKSPIYPENLELCKAYEGNLNSFPEIREPFACERPLNPELKAFSKPEWKELDASKYVELLVEIERVKYRQYTRAYPFDELGYRKGIQENIRQGRIRLKVAELDIVPSPSSDNRGPDGISEKVLRVERGDPKCDPTDDKWRRSPPVKEYFIVDNELTKVENFSTLMQTMDIFLYKGKVYFDVFYTTDGVDAVPGVDGPGKLHRYEVRVNKPYSNGVVPICRYLDIE